MYIRSYAGMCDVCMYVMYIRSYVCMYVSPAITRLNKSLLKASVFWKEADGVGGEGLLKASRLRFFDYDFLTTIFRLQLLRLPINN